MKTCVACNVQFNDGVQCGTCKKHLDFGCANITESGWRKLGIDRRSQWKCPTCRISSPAVTAPDQAQLDTILSEMRDMKRQLLILPTLKDDIRTVKDELTELRTTCNSFGDKFDEFSTRLMELELKTIEFEKLQETVNSLQTELARAKYELSSQDQRSRLNNVEIKGIPLKKDENLFTVLDAIGHKVNYNCPKTQVNFISRVPIHNSKEKLIIVSFLNRYIKEDFIAAARAQKELSTTDIGFQGTPQRVYVNDHLTVEYKKLLTRAKTVAKSKNYEFVWVKHGKIHIRKNMTSRDLEVKDGGTWLAISPLRRKLGVLLNLPGGPKKENAQSRGKIVADYVRNEEPVKEYIEKNKTSMEDCNDFIFVSVEFRKSTPSIFSYSNANSRLLAHNNTFVGFGNSLPGTPLKKVGAGISKLKEICSTYNKVSKRQELVEKLIEMLKCDERHLPDQELEFRVPNLYKEVSSIYVCVPQERYGTRTHTIILMTKTGHIDVMESTQKSPIDPMNPQWSSSEFQFDIDLTT